MGSWVDARWIVGLGGSSNSLLFLLAVSSAQQEWHICIKHNTYHISKCFGAQLKVSGPEWSKQGLILKSQVKSNKCLVSHM